MDSTQTNSLLRFWIEHGQRGRIGLFHLDFAPAKLINWGQKRLTKDGKPSPWVHCFLFMEAREGMPWIAESDMSLPIPGFRKASDGPQFNPVSKWLQRIDQAAVIDPQLTSAQMKIAESKAEELTRAGFKYGLINLGGTYVSVLKHDLSHHSFLHRESAMHCGHFVRVCLKVAGIDPWGEKVCDENTAPELIYQQFPPVAEWHKN